MKLLTAAAVCVVLTGQLSPIAAGVLLCIGDGTASDCCPEGLDSREFHLEESTRLLDGSDCRCCILVDAAPSTAGESCHKASVDAVQGSALRRSLHPPTAAPCLEAPAGDAGEAGISSLSTVVLLI